MTQRHCHILFLDGVGLGVDNPHTNPFAFAKLPHLTTLLGEKWYATRETITTARATLVPTDANLGVDGLPQSASGQAALTTGRNVPLLIGRHIGPWPTKEIRLEILRGNLFRDIHANGGKVALFNPYPESYFEAVKTGRRSHSALVFSAVTAGIDLFGTDDLRAGRAISPGFTNHSWRKRLNMPTMPVLTPVEAGRRLAQLAQQYTFSVLDHWLTDFYGHRGPLDEAARHVELIDAVVGGVLSAWDDANGLLIITSDHGNIEDKSQRRHTRNPVPTILVGNGHTQLAQSLEDLTDIAKVVQRFL